jgi:rhamnosyltransferase
VTTKTEIDVLLATYNGSKFLESFLISLLAQKNVTINLIASDDHSSDSTKQILLNYSQYFKNFRLLTGPGAGPSKNFLFLMQHANSNFIAFADQDDVWDECHLMNAIGRLGSQHLTPALTYCDVVEFRGNFEGQKQWPNLKESPSFMSFLFQNYARGCTIVFNQPLNQIILKDCSSPNIIMHDWWLTLNAFLNGNVIYEPRAEVFYRLHSENVIGIKRKKTLFRILDLLKYGFAPLKQIKSLQMLPTSRTNPQNYEILSEVNLILELPFLKRIQALLFGRFRFRDTFFDNIKLIFVLSLPRKVILRNLKI